jgi:hypothetical protein
LKELSLFEQAESAAAIKNNWRYFIASSEEVKGIWQRPKTNSVYPPRHGGGDRRGGHGGG